MTEWQSSPWFLVDSSVFAPGCGILATVQSAVRRHDCGAHSRSAKADAQAGREVEPEAEHRIVMHDAAFDPISAIPAREHMKQQER
jgi:hypothetical protein